MSFNRRQRVAWFWSLTLAIALGSSFAYSHYKRASRIQAAYLPTEGEIIAHEVERTWFGSNEMHSTIVPRFRYEVNAQIYESTRVSVITKTENEKAKYYPVGTKVTVWYDPDNPRMAVLEKPNLNAFWSVVAAIALIWVGLGLFAFRRH